MSARTPQDRVDVGSYRQERNTALMKTTKLVIMIAMIALALFLILPNLSWAGL